VIYYSGMTPIIGMLLQAALLAPVEHETAAEQQAD
jgi:hypothetical protein